MPRVKISSARVASPNVPKQKIVPKSYPCVIRKVAKRPSEQDNHPTKVRKTDNSDDSLSDSELLSCVQDSNKFRLVEIMCTYSMKIINIYIVGSSKFYMQIMTDRPTYYCMNCQEK